MRRNTRPLAHRKVAGLPRHRRDTNSQPVPTFQPDPETPLAPQLPITPEDEAVEAAINRMVEAAYT